MEDPTRTMQLDISSLIYVKNLKEENDDDSLIKNKGKRKWDNVDPSGKDPEEATRSLCLQEDENLQIAMPNSLFDSHCIPLTSDDVGASTNRAPVELKMPSQLILPAEPLFPYR